MRLPQRALLFAVLVLLLPAAAHRLTAGPTPSPEKPLPMLTVEATYPGANAQVVADTVAAPVEQQVNGVEGLRRLYSRCTDDGRYTLQVIFDPGVDLTLAQVLVQNRLNLALPMLPDAVKQLGVTVKKKSPGVLLFVVLYSPNGRYDNLYLSNYASIQIKDELARVRGVGDVTMFGGQEYGLRIWLGPDRLAARNLTAGDVVKALREQNAQVTGGPEAPYTVPTLGRLADVEAFGDVVLKTSTDAHVIRLKDVARLELGGDSSRHFARLDGKPVVALGLFPSPQARPRDVAAAVQEEMERLKDRFPPGLDYTLTFDLAPVWEPRDRVMAPGYLLVEPAPQNHLTSEVALKLVDRCGAILTRTEGVQHVLDLSEDPFGRFGDGPCLLAQLAPDLTRADREKLMQSVRTRLGQVEGAEPRLRELTGPGDYPVDLALRGPKTEDVREFAARLVERLARSGKVTDLVVQPGPRQPSLTLDIDRKALATRGVDLSDLHVALETYLGPLHVRDFSKFGRTWPVQVQRDAPDRDRVEGIKRLKVRNAQGEMVPLFGLLTIREATAAGPVDRLDFEPVAEVTANPAGRVSLGQARWLCETLAEEVRKGLQLPPAYGLVWLQDLPEPKPMPGAERNAAPDPPPPEVRVSKPVAREVTDYEVFTGRTQAVATVELRPRVSGYLAEAPFKEGSDVKKGERLFEIDPRPYQAHLERAQGQVQVQEASLKLALATYDRDRAAAKAAPGSVSQPQLDQDRAAVEEAEARLKAARADIEARKLSLDFTHVTAPIDGRIGRRLLDPGNLVKADDTLLATIVSLDPMYVYFDMDERTLLRLRQLAREGQGKAPEEGQTPVFLGLANDKDFPRRGVVNFVDNQVSPETGTVRARAVFRNPDRLLSPGLFARVRLPVGAPHKALLVPEEAVGTDEGQKLVYIVNDQNKVVSQPVTVGPAHDGLRAIEEGLRPDDRVIIRGLRKVRPGMTVKPRLEPAPGK